MNESTTSREGHLTARASLAAIGVKVRQLDLFGPIHEQVRIAQKTVKHAPTDKLYDAWISMLAGAQGLVEINTRLRADSALQAAFGRSQCAEQSVVQGTLDACTSEHVHQLEQALEAIYRQHSRSSRHDYSRDWQILDVDRSGMPCGKKAAFASKGYFAKQRNRRGRQWGRVLATCYEEVVVDRLFDGTTHPTTVLLAYVSLYDQRGGGVETSFKGDKHGLGSTKRTKKRFAAQQIVMLLGSLAHNVVVWTRRWLAVPRLQRYGMLRMVRDVFHISGFLAFDPLGQVVQIVLNQDALLAPMHIVVNLAKT